MAVKSKKSIKINRAVKKPAKNLPAVVEKKEKTLSLADPAQVMGFGKTLKDFIIKNELSIKIGTTDYAMVDGWKYAGLNFGLTAIPSKPVAKHKPGEYITILYSLVDAYTKDRKKYQKEIPVFVGMSHDKGIIDEIRLREKITKEVTRPYFSYDCECDIERLSDKSKVQYGIANCSNLELEKVSFNENSILSMSQTRAIGKAYRNTIGFVMKAAGLGTTPAEEMTPDMKENSYSNFTEVSDLPGLSDTQFQNCIRKVIAGEMTVEKIKEHSTLTSEQENALKIAEQSRANR